MSINVPKIALCKEIESPESSTFSLVFLISRQSLQQPMIDQLRAFFWCIDIGIWLVLTVINRGFKHSKLLTQPTMINQLRAFFWSNSWVKRTHITESLGTRLTHASLSRLHGLELTVFPACVRESASWAAMVLFPTPPFPDSTRITWRTPWSMSGVCMCMCEKYKTV